MNTRAVLNSRDKGAVNPVARSIPAVSPCIRWDYSDASKGQESIQLYFFNGSLVGFHWVKDTKKNQGGKTPGKNQPDVGGQPQQMLQRRWALLVGAASQGQWPNYQVIRQSLGRPHQEKRNVTMNTKAILNSRDKGAVNPAVRAFPAVSPCVRWDYPDASKGQESIQLYFFNGSLAGFQWVKNTKKNQGNKIGGKKPGNKNRGKGKSGKTGPRSR